METLTSEQFISELVLKKDERELASVQRSYRDEAPGNKFLGIRMKNIFELAKKYMDMPAAEIAKLLASQYYEARVGAVSIMDFKARAKNTPAEVKKSLFDLYISKHHRINNWDMVDRAAPYVVGGYLFDKNREPLYRLAASKNVWERRTAIVATYYFIRMDDLQDTFRIAELLVNDDHDLIQKAVGSWIREAGKKDKLLLTGFLDEHASGMPRTMLRYAIEKMNDKEKQHYLSVNKNQSK